MLKKVPIILIVMGLLLISGGVVFGQDPGDGKRRPPPPIGNPPPRDDRRGNGEDNGGRGRSPDANTDRQNDATEQTLLETSLPLGGDNTVEDVSAEAFANHPPGFDENQIALFEEGDELFEFAFDDAGGLGPVFNANSCESCHGGDGRGRAPEFNGETESGLLIRLALPIRADNGGFLGDAMYGGQLQDISIAGTPREGDMAITYVEITGTFADGTPYRLRQPVYNIANLGYGPMDDAVTFSPRVANQMIGLGLLEAVDAATIWSLADENDANGDGISGRPNLVWDAINQQLTLGRFGWKANQPNLLQQTAGAFNGDMGITTSVFPNQPCTAGQAACDSAASAPELGDEDLAAVVFYSSSLSIPAQRNADDPTVQWGEDLFEAAQCSSCHIPQMTTGTHPTIPQLSNQTIRPYTDLLLHDMGDGLADGQSDFLASGYEWRTPPLWGIGLFETVNGHTYYLHDGRARNLTEAILWHGGEAQASQQAFIQMSAEERAALIAFLESL